jgi:hypothetical protein
MWGIDFLLFHPKSIHHFQPKFEMGLGVGVNRVSKNGKVKISYLMVFIVFEKVCRKYICFLAFYWRKKLLTLMLLYKSLFQGPRSPIWSHDSEVVQFCAPTHIKVYIYIYIYMFSKHACKFTFFKLQQLR